MVTGGYSTKIKLYSVQFKFKELQMFYVCEFWVLSFALLTNNLSEDIFIQVWLYSFAMLQITRSKIIPHITWADSLVIADGQLSSSWICVG